MTRNTIHIRKARRDWLSTKRNNLKAATVRSYENISGDFVDYVESNDIEAVEGINGYLIEQWKLKRKNEDNVSPATLKNNLKHIRVFIRWCESTELIEHGLADKIQIPSISEEQERSNEIVEPEQIQSILSHLELYEYGTRFHAITALLWHTGIRISAAVSLDLEDFEPRVNTIKVRNRRATGTSLKNGNKSERNITISDEIVDVLNDYIEGRRISVDDEYNREPLFTTERGRVDRQVVYKNFIGISRPCVYANDCPHGRDIEECKAARLKREAYDCPSSGALHPIRRGSITYHLNQDWPIEKVSERCDVSVSVLQKHYDARTHEDKRQGRSQFVDNL
jgi:site-specific recombinase XerD